MVKTIGAREARSNFSQLLGQVHFDGQVVIVGVALPPLSAYGNDILVISPWPKRCFAISNCHLSGRIAHRLQVQHLGHS